MQITPFYTFPGTSRTLDVRTITEIAPASNGNGVVGHANGYPFHAPLEGVEPADICAEVSALMRECYTLSDHRPLSPADRAEQARIIGQEAGKVIGFEVARTLKQALSTESGTGWSFAKGLISAISDAARK